MNKDHNEDKIKNGFNILKGFVEVLNSKNVPSTIILKEEYYLSTTKESPDVPRINEIVKDINVLFKSLSILSNKGFVNDANVDLPILRLFVTEFKIVKKNSGFSIYLNILFYNMILLLLLEKIITIEKQCLPQIVLLGCVDLKVDLANIRKSILRMINPDIRERVSNRGLSITLSSLVGYDSEYELNSSSRMVNDLLSIQLAGSTGAVLKIPVVSKYSKKDLNIGYTLNKDEVKLGNIFHNSISVVVDNIRRILYENNDKLLRDLIDLLDNKRVKKVIIDSYLVYSFDKSNVESYFKRVSSYSSKDLIIDSDSLNKDNHVKSLTKIIGYLNEICKKTMSDKLLQCINSSSNKPQSRITYKFAETRLSITINRVLYICMHESAADLSILKDFVTFKENLDIVSRSFVTLGKPLRFDWCKSRVHFRDTILTAPAGSKSLASIGSIYGEGFQKIDIGSYRNGKMRELLDEKKELFKEYAIRDAIITHKHASSMEDFYLTVLKIGVPLTISSVAKAYVLKEWSVMKYNGYQYGKDLDLSVLMTPKGARSVDISNYIVPFMAGFRGGRNESFSYGVDDNLKSENRVWIDYDLTSCYTTVMSILGHPQLDKAVNIYNQTVIEMSAQDLLFNYIVLDVEFRFNADVKYPCIPTRVDNNADVYPLEGRSIITGPEYLVAKSMGCHLFVKRGYMIPFEVVVNKASKAKQSKQSQAKDIKLVHNNPFRSIVKDLQRKRREHPKKTFLNYMYKELGNSIYGQIAMGISMKKTFDVKTKSYVSVKGGVLSSPILASYITGFTRALIGECLFNIHKLDGRVLSVTTDGFITNVDDLEDKILNMDTKKDCLMLYKEMRKHLTTFKDTDCEPDDRALEIKTIEDTGIISCKTRVQIGFNEGGIMATTGFQTRNLEKKFLIEEFSNIITNNYECKAIDYIQTGLRSASDIYKKGGHVLMTFKDRSFNLDFDNKRCIDSKEDVSMSDSEPWKNIKPFVRIRELYNNTTKPVYTKCFIGNQSKSYKSYIETSVRGFVKACLSMDRRYGIPLGRFTSYKSIIDFVYVYEPAREVKLSLTSLSRLKNRITIPRSVPRTSENEGFVEYVKLNIKDFDSELFFKELSSESIKKQKSLKKEKVDIS